MVRNENLNLIINEIKEYSTVNKNSINISGNFELHFKNLKNLFFKKFISLPIEDKEELELNGEDIYFIILRECFGIEIYISFDYDNEGKKMLTVKDGILENLIFYSELELSNEEYLNNKHFSDEIIKTILVMSKMLIDIRESTNGNAIKNLFIINESNQLINVKESPTVNTPMDKYHHSIENQYSDTKYLVELSEDEFNEVSERWNKKYLSLLKETIIAIALPIRNNNIELIDSGLKFSELLDLFITQFRELEEKFFESEMKKSRCTTHEIIVFFAKRVLNIDVGVEYFNSYTDNKLLNYLGGDIAIDLNGINPNSSKEEVFSKIIEIPHKNNMNTFITSIYEIYKKRNQ